MKSSKAAGEATLVAGVTKERIVMLSDGVFAIAATLLVLELKIPEGESGIPLTTAMVHVMPSFLAYTLSFFTIALYWSAYHRAMSILREVDRAIIFINVVLLFLISLQPFPTALLGRYGPIFPVVALYATVMSLTGAMLWLIWRRGMRSPELLQVDGGQRSLRAVGFRLFITPIVFALSVPIAYWDPRAAMVSWVLILVFTLVARALYR
jgi:uncharacterized membrane protein